MSVQVLPAIDPAKVEEAAMKACGFDRVSAEIRTITIAMAQKYGLELPLRHLLPIDGKPYITRDGLLHVAHKSGQLDGIVVEEEGGDAKDGWWAVVSVYRKDMKYPFKFRGRYSGANKKYGPEMATKCAEVMGLRRAFDVSIPVVEERASEEDVVSATEPAPPSASRAPSPVAAPAPKPAPTRACAAPEFAALMAAIKLAKPADAAAYLSGIVRRPVTSATITTEEAVAARMEILADIAREAASVGATAPTE